MKMLCKKCLNEVEKFERQGSIITICEKCSIEDVQKFYDLKLLGVEKRRINIHFGCAKKGSKIKVEMEPRQIIPLYVPELYEKNHMITCKCGNYPLHIISNDEGNYAYCAECYEKMFEEK